MSSPSRGSSAVIRPPWVKMPCNGSFFNDYDAGGIGAGSRWLSEGRATPPVRDERGMHPGGRASLGESAIGGSVQVALVVGHAGALEKLHEFFPEGLPPMVHFLFGDVVPDGRHRRRAHGEGGVSLLPRKPRIAARIGSPLRRCLFQIAHKVREAVGGFQADEQMHVVGDSADALGRASEAARSSAEVVVECIAPLRNDQWATLFRGEDEVIMEAGVGRRHRALASTPSGVLAMGKPISGGGARASRNHRLPAVTPPASPSAGESTEQFLTDY